MQYFLSPASKRVCPKCAMGFCPAHQLGKARFNTFSDDWGKNIVLKRQTMSGDIDEWYDENIGDPMQEFLNSVNDGVTRLWEDISNNLSQIDWQNFFSEENLQFIGQQLANVVLQINPAYIASQAFSTNPLTEHLYRELDNLTGGTLSTSMNVTTLPMRALRGDALSKEELLKDAIFALQIAVVVLSGGTASSIVSTASGRMSEGTLGQSDFGKAILAIASAGALAALNKSNIAEEMAKEMVRQGVSAEKKDLIANSPLGETELGRALLGVMAGAATGAGISVVTGGGITEGISQGAKDALNAEVKNAAVVNAGKNVPLGDKIVGGILNNNPIDVTKIPGNLAQGAANAFSSSGSGSTSFVDTLSSFFSKAGSSVANLPQNIINELSRIPANAATAANNIYNEAGRTPGNIADAGKAVWLETSKLPKNAYEEIKRTPGNIYNAFASIPKLITTPKLSGGYISMRLPTWAETKEAALDVKDFLRRASTLYGQLMEIYTAIGRFYARRRIRVRTPGGQDMWAYELVDGSWYFEEFPPEINWKLFLGLAAAAALVLGEAS